MIFAQSENTTKPPIDQRLYDVFDAKTLEQMQEKTPSMLAYYNFFLDNAYEIQPLSITKTSDYIDVTIDDLSHLNILKVINEQSLKRDYNNQTIYKIAGTNKMLILVSEKELVEQFNLHTGRNH